MEHTDIIVSRRGELETIDDGSGVRITLLASKLVSNALESYEISLAQGCSIVLKELPSFINGERFVLMKTGTVSLSTPKSELSLSGEDSANFKSYLPCVIKNTASSPAVLFINGTPPLL